MKPKPQIDLDAAGAEALQLFAQDRVASGNLKDIRSQRIARKEQLKKVLPIIWAALEAGQPVNGYTTKESWCKEYAKVEMRTVQYIIYGRKTKDANTVRPNLKITHLDFAYDRSKDAKRLTFYLDFEIVNPDQTVAGDVKLRVSVTGAKTRETYDVATKKMTALIKQVRLWNEKSAADFKAGIKSYFEEVEVKPTPAPKPERVKKVKVKKLTPGETAHELASMRSLYSRNLNPDDESREWSERYLKFFEEQVAAHPEWRDQQIEAERKKIKYQINRRAYAEPEVSEPAQPKETIFISHRVGQTYDAGGSRSETYALCGQRFTKKSWAVGAPRHVNAHNETPTCEKCLKLIAEQQVSETAQVLAAATDGAKKSETPAG